MANVTVTNQIIAREAAAILEEQSPFLMNCNRGYDNEFQKNVNGYAVGDNVDIKVPPIGVVFDGAVFAGGGAAADSVETKVNLKLDIWKHIALSFTTKERALEVTDFTNRIIKPQMQTLSSWLEAEFIKRAVQATPNWIGTAGTIPTTMKTYAQARAKLENFLASSADRTMLFSSDANVELVDASKALFNPQRQIEKMFMQGSLGEAMGAMWYEHQSIPTLTTGTQASFTVSGANQTGSTLAIGGLTASNTILKGTKFTLPNVFATHPQTGAVTAKLMQFTVTADFTASGTTGSISIYPALNPAAPNKNVSASPANAATATLYAGASAAVTQNLMFQKNAFAVATAPLERIVGADSEIATLPNGLSVRVTTFGDGVNSKNGTRIDILAGFAAPRGNHACVVLQ